MLRSITYAQFQRWQFFYDLEPFDERRMDYRFGSIVQALANINRDSKKRHQPFELEECTLTFGQREEIVQKPEPAKKLSWQVMKEYAKTVVSAFNAPGK
jgi:hypothetical protein